MCWPLIYSRNLIARSPPHKRWTYTRAGSHIRCDRAHFPQPFQRPDWIPWAAVGLQLRWYISRYAHHKLAYPAYLMQGRKLFKNSKQPKFSIKPTWHGELNATALSEREIRQTLELTVTLRIDLEVAQITLLLEVALASGGRKIEVSHFNIQKKSYFLSLPTCVAHSDASPLMLL